MNTTTKILIGAGTAILLYKGAQKILAWRDMGKNLKFDLTFNRIHQVYIKDLQLRCKIVLNLIIHNTSPASYSIRDFVSTVYNNTEEYQIASTKPEDIEIPAYKSITKTIEFDINIFAFATSMTEKYVIKVVNKFNLLGFQIKASAVEINIASYLKSYLNALDWIKQYISQAKGGELRGIKCLENQKPLELLN